MAIDYGEARTGVAFSDLTQTIVGRAETLALTSKKLVAKIIELAQQNDVELAVVGLPLNMDDTPGERTEKTERFAEKLRRRGLNIVLQDERLTTVEAHEILRETGSKASVDSIAASLILEEYLRNRA